jgi:6-phosphogluconolactonase
MPATPELIVQSSAQRLAIDVASRTLATLAHAQQYRERAALVLTAGSIMEKVWTALAASAATAASAAVDWSRLDVFFGDERYVPADSADRNDKPARELLFSYPPFSAAHLHPMPASDGPFGADLDAAAASYADELFKVRRSDDPDRVPNFDVILLGLGPDGHCASLFPEHPGVYDDSAPVIAVRNSPKPPPNRLSLSFSGLAAANEIWLVASGVEKAKAVALAADGAGKVQIPAAGARGRFRTLWLIDKAAASELPGGRYDPPIS